ASARARARARVVRARWSARLDAARRPRTAGPALGRAAARLRGRALRPRPAARRPAPALLAAPLPRLRGRRGSPVRLVRPRRPAACGARDDGGATPDAGHVRAPPPPLTRASPGRRGP